MIFQVLEKATEERYQNRQKQSCSQLTQEMQSTHKIKKRNARTSSPQAEFLKSRSIAKKSYCAKPRSLDCRLDGISHVSQFFINEPIRDRKSSDIYSSSSAEESSFALLGGIKQHGSSHQANNKSKNQSFQQLIETNKKSKVMRLRTGV